MKDVVAVLGEWKSDGPIHVELVASGIKDAGHNRTREVGLKAMAKALASCPPLSADCVILPNHPDTGVQELASSSPFSTECVGPVSIEVESDEGSLTLFLKIGSVTVKVVIRADAESIADNADVMIDEHVN